MIMKQTISLRENKIQGGFQLQPTHQCSSTPGGRSGLPANGFANVLTCYKGYSAIQVPHPLHLTCRIAPFRDGSNIVKTTSTLVGPLFAIASQTIFNEKENLITS